MKRALDYWASIELSDVALYVTTSTEFATKNVGGVPKFFRPVLRIGQIRRTFPALDVAAELPATCTVTLVNQDGWLDSFLGFGRHARVWDNREVTVKYQPGGAIPFTAFDAAIPVEFKGRIRRGTLVHDRDEVSFELYDIRQGHDKPILTNTFGTGANVEDKAKGVLIPVVFGDFTDGSGDGFSHDGGGRLPAYCTDLATSTFKVADHEILAASLTVYKNGSVIAYDTFNPLNATFTIPTAGYDPTADVITVDFAGVQAAPFVSGGGAQTLQYAADIIAEILFDYGGVASIEIGASFTTAHAAGDQHFNRRWIGEQLTVMEAVAELAFENNYLFFTSPTTYELAFNIPRAAVTAAISEVEPVLDSVRSVYDPDSVYCNVLISSYNPDATGNAGSAYRDVLSYTNATAVTEYGDEVTREIDFNWLFLSSNVRLQAQRKLLVFSSKVHYVDFELAAQDTGDTFWRMTLADTLTLTYWQYAGSPLQIRGLGRDAQTGRIQVRALAVQDAFQVSQWAGGTAAVPTGVTFPAKWNDAAVTQVPAGRWF